MMGRCQVVLGHLFFMAFYQVWCCYPLKTIGVAPNLVECFCWDTWDPTPPATAYCSGVLINSIAPSTNDNQYPAQLHCTEAYQSLIGSIGWLATATCLDLAPAHSFLSSYNGKPSLGHMRATLYALHYIHLTHDHGISFSSLATAPIHIYIHFPDGNLFQC